MRDATTQELIKHIRQVSNSVRRIVEITETPLGDKVLELATDVEDKPIRCEPAYDKSYGQVVICHQDAGTETIPHKHDDSVEIFFAWRGSFICCGKRINRGEHIVIPAGEVYSCRAEEDCIYMAALHPREEAYRVD